MGDRATIQLTSGEDEFSPLIYLHWAGSRVEEIISAAAPIMRAGDITYAFARLVGVCHEQTGPDQGLSLGVWNASEIIESDRVGDNGHYRLDVRTGQLTNYDWDDQTHDLGTFSLGHF